MENSGSINHAGRCRQVLKSIFDYAMDQDLMDVGRNPANKPQTEGVGHKPKNNPAID